MVELSTSICQLSSAFFASLLKLPKVLENFFSYGRNGAARRGSSTVTALNGTLLFGPLFSTEKPKGVGGDSSTWRNRLPLDLLWPEGCLMFRLANSEPPKSTLHESGLSGPPRAHCQKRSCFLWDFKAWLLNLLDQITQFLFKRKKRLLLNVEVGRVRASTDGKVGKGV